ncbi:MAG TPA: hypothetical protein VG297_03290 [Bryobacteraceae bacterium]|jgi:hypothetical protein|nr:hypothetical protein [Bryobacteraceae bacterium]
MKSTKKIPLFRVSVSLLALAGFAAAQDQTPHGWRSVNDPLPATLDPASPSGVLDQAPDQNGAPPPNYNAQPNLAQAAPAYPQGNAQGNYPPPPPYNGPAQNGPNAQQGNYPPPPDVPARLTIKAGTYVTVRMNQWLSSDRNQPGDSFTATLEQPLVVDGIVVAQRGQTVTGRVSEAQKAGRVEGTSRLGVQLTGLVLVDGQQANVQAQMINRTGSTSQGRDAAAIGGTTALGAIIGAGVDNGRGAAIGAGAGAAAGILGVLLTRGRPTVIYPETVLTFQIDAPITIATGRAPQAFRDVDARDYGQQAPAAGPRYSGGPAGGYAGGPAGAPPPPAAPYYGSGYYGYGYPYPYYGGFSLFVGPRYGYAYGPRFYGGYRIRR